MKRKLAGLTASERKEKSQRLSRRLSQLLDGKSSIIQEKAMIGGFAPLEDEPLWHLDLGNHWRERLAFPGVVVEEEEEGGGRGKTMSFFAAHLEDLRSSRDFGVEILVPPPSASPVIPSLLLVPGIAFTKTGVRLGRGKGYYDRYLADFKGTRVGVCFDLQLARELPRAPHDQLVDFIVTEKEVMNTRERVRGVEK